MRRLAKQLLNLGLSTGPASPAHVAERVTIKEELQTSNPKLSLGTDNGIKPKGLVATCLETAFPSPNRPLRAVHAERHGVCPIVTLPEGNISGHRHDGEQPTVVLQTSHKSQVEKAYINTSPARSTQTSKVEASDLKLSPRCPHVGAVQTSGDLQFAAQFTLHGSLMICLCP